MKAVLKTERDVETKILQPLFREVLGYADSDMEWAKPVRLTFGRETRTKEADLVVSYKNRPVLAVEAKRPTEAVQKWLDQIDSYAFALQTPYSIITNGRHFVLRGYYSFNSRINVIDESLDQVKRKNWKKLANLIGINNIGTAINEPANQIVEPDATKIQDYRRFFRKIHNAIRDRDRLDPAAAFDELSKLLFLKAAEDATVGAKRRVLTVRQIEEWEELGVAKVESHVNTWFRDATESLFKGVFETDPRINLSPGTLKAVIEMMRPFHVKDEELDVKGRAFEEFLPSQLRGKGLGQFFTPRPIVNFMADLAGISIHDVVVDFSCGSGGFLIKAFEQMQRAVDELPTGTVKRLGTTKDKIREDIKSHQIFGIDAEPRAARTAKMNMLMWGDGKRVVRGNGLDTKDRAGNPYDVCEYDPTEASSGCTLILANPPFGSTEQDPAVLSRYELGSRDRTKKSEHTEILFLEKGLNLLRPEGRMLIVIPQGLLSGTSNDRVRDFIHARAEIRAIISLPTHTFAQSGVPTVNTCILYVQKFTNEKKALYDESTAGLTAEEIRVLLRSDKTLDYPIFMGSADYIGYEPSGRMIGAMGELTDLDALLTDFVNQDTITNPEIDVFEFASEHYGVRSHRRKEQTIRGTTKGLKTSFVVPLSQTNDRLDPPFYLFKKQSAHLVEALTPLGMRVVEAGPKWEPTTDAELDTEYRVLSVSSDGTVTLNEHRRGEAITQKYRRVKAGDIAYNPMRVNIGSIGVVPTELDGGLVSPDYVVFESLDLLPEFLVTLLRSPFYRLYIDVVTTGSIRDRLYFEDLQTIRVPTVPVSEQLSLCAAARRADADTDAILDRLLHERTKVTSALHDLVVGEGAARSDARGLDVSFRALADRWMRETGHLSSVRKKVDHPAYKSIIALGERAVPLILKELLARPAHWFAALHEITKVSPYGASTARDTRSATAAWLQWGREHGYLEQ